MSDSWLASIPAVVLFVLLGACVFMLAVTSLRRMKDLHDGLNRFIKRHKESDNGDTKI